MRNQQDGTVGGGAPGAAGRWAAWDKQYLWHPFTPMRPWLEEEPLVIERGEGAVLYDTAGRAYLDGVSSLWCNVHGHRHPHIDAAVRAQLDRIAHSTLLGLASPPSIELARRLVQWAPPGLTRVFYSDNGATAVEVALKIAFQYWRLVGQPRRVKFVALGEAYHGDTLGAVSVGGIPLFREIFGGLTFEALFCPSPHPYRFEGTPPECCRERLAQMERLLRERGEEVAAIVLEPLVQGAAGIIVHPAGFLRGAAELARRYRVLLIADEVATGFGKTGTMFACAQEGVAPDLMCLAKGLTGGYLPLAATLVSERVFEPFLSERRGETTFYHGHTYTGNALGCAAALANLEVFERERTLEQLAPKIKLMDERLREAARLAWVGDVRRRGVMTGIELVADQGAKRSFDPARRVGARLCQALRRRGVLLRPLGDVVVVMPPLAITLEQLDRLLAAVTEGLREDLPRLLRE